MSSETAVSEIAVDILSIQTTTMSLQQTCTAAVEATTIVFKSDGIQVETSVDPGNDALDADYQISAAPTADAFDTDHSTTATPPASSRTVPSWDPLPELESSYVSKYSADLFRAALNGDWKKVLKIASEGPAWLRTSITKGGETVLHIAAAARHLEVVAVVIEPDPASLIYTNKDGSTPFCFAAVSRVIEIAEMMQQQNNELPNIRGRQGMIPLHMAVLVGHRAMVWYLLKVTDDIKLTDQERIEILTSSIDSDMFDVALHIVRKNLGLALLRDSKGETALHALARKPLKLGIHQPSVLRIFGGSSTGQGREHKAALELTEILWNQVIQQKKEDISASIHKPWRLLFVAARLGKVEFLTILIRTYPELIWKKDDNGYSIFHIAVIHRQVEIFKLIHEIGAIKKIIALYKDERKNNMLHLASKLAPPSRLSCVSGAALQMQHQLQWFEVVKQIVRSEYIEAENEDRETPQTLFSKEHEKLRKQGEDWMKKTAESGALVAALLATIVFSAAFQLPGGFNDNTASPILVKNPSFVFFAMSNVVSLFTSTASILMFLSILTSRYSERDFLISLPQKLMMGLILLLISIATMVVGFTVTFFITFHEGARWPPITTAIFASVPVTLFALQQFPLLAEMYYSTYKYRNIFLSRQEVLFQAPPLKLSPLDRQNPKTPHYPLKERYLEHTLENYLPQKKFI